MRSVTFRIVPIVLVVSVGLALHSARAGSPGGVSPGSPNRIFEIEARCPTFSWQEVPDAVGYELVAYGLPDGVEGAAVTSADLVPETEVLYARVPGGATSWPLPAPSRSTGATSRTYRPTWPTASTPP